MATHSSSLAWRMEWGRKGMEFRAKELTICNPKDQHLESDLCGLEHVPRLLRKLWAIIRHVQLICVQPLWLEESSKNCGNSGPGLWHYTTLGRKGCVLVDKATVWRWTLRQTSRACNVEGRVDRVLDYHCSGSRYLPNRTGQGNLTGTSYKNNCNCW